MKHKCCYQIEAKVLFVHLGWEFVSQLIDDAVHILVMAGTKRQCRQNYVP